MNYRPQRLDYDKCKLKELQGFIEARTGEDAPSTAIRRKLIRQLVQLDRKASFSKFMDLPPELRLLVYEPLLHRDTEIGARAQLSILSVSKQVNREAQGVLEAQSVSRLSLNFSRIQRTVYDPTTRPSAYHQPVWYFAAHEDLDIILRRQEVPLPTRYQDLLFVNLERLRRVQTFYLKLTIEDLLKDGNGSFRAAEKFFSALVGVCTSLKKVEVEVEFYEASGDEKLLEIIKPLIDLPETCTLRLRGVPVVTEIAFWRTAAEA